MKVQLILLILSKRSTRLVCSWLLCLIVLFAALFGNKLLLLIKQVLYTDGDEEILNLKKERWEFIEDSLTSDVSYLNDCFFCFSWSRLPLRSFLTPLYWQEQTAEHSSPDSTPEMYDSFSLSLSLLPPHPPATHPSSDVYIAAFLCWLHTLLLGKLIEDRLSAT